MSTRIKDGFEEGFYLYNDTNELECPIGWTPVWKHSSVEGELDQPEYKPAGSDQVRTGENAAAIHSRYSSIDGALMKMFGVEQGAKVSASTWMLKTEDGMGHGMRIGIDPTGGKDHNDESVVWSDWYSSNSDDYEQDEWRKREVSTVAQWVVITVFLQSKCDFAANSTNSHFDDFTLALGNSAPTPGERDLDIKLEINGEIVFNKSYLIKLEEVK